MAKNSPKYIKEEISSDQHEIEKEKRQSEEYKLLEAISEG
jgi:hypothetical protein